MKAICLVGKFARRVRPAGACGDRSYMDEKLRILSVCDEIITIERYKKWCEGEIVKLPVHFNDNNWEPVSDPCVSCQKLFSMNESLEYWQTACMSSRRDAAYWREELTKLQNEALAECKPLSEVAKCYIQVAPEKLLMSQEARRVIEFLEAAGRSMYLGGIRTGMEPIMLGTAIMDGLIEAREAGIVRLDDGKYSIARD